MDEDGPIYKNPVSNVTIDRNINSMQYANFRDIGSEYMLREFLNDINANNDAIELSLINNKAYKEAVGAIDDTAATNTEEAVDVLTDALIKYRTEMAYATDNKPKMDKKDYHTFLKGNKTYLKNEVRKYLQQLNEDGDLKGQINGLITSGNTYKIFEEIHSREKGEYITAKVRDDIETKLEVAHEEDPDYYIGLLKAVENAEGRRSTKGTLARKANRENVISDLLGHYSKRLGEKTEDYRSERAKEKAKDAHEGHGAEVHH